MPLPCCGVWRYESFVEQDNCYATRLAGERNVYQFYGTPPTHAMSRSMT
jgi:hypothetical protein